MKRSAFNHRKIKRLAAEIKEPVWAARDDADPDAWMVLVRRARDGACEAD